MRRRPASIAVAASLTAIVLAAAPAASARKLTLGLDGLDVRHVKEDLAQRGYLPWSAVDKSFDQRTWHAVVAFQGRQRLPRDGVVGGVAHQAPSVPAYPASHGCVRVPAQWSAVAWRYGRVGDRVWIAAERGPNARWPPRGTATDLRSCVRPTRLRHGRRSSPCGRR